MSVDAFLESMPQESMGCSTPNTDSEESSFQLGQIFQYSCLEMIRVSRSEYPTKRSNFTIDHILGKQDTTSNEENYTDSPNIRYDWLAYTRYKPPKLQRIRKKECARRRRLGRNPRIPFSTEQVAILENKFRSSPYLSNSDVLHLSKCLELSESRIKIWFQNRRARERRDGQESSKRDLNLIKNFLIKTRPSEAVRDDVQDLSISAFKPCHKQLHFQ